MWRDAATFNGGFLIGDLFSDSADDGLFKTRGTWDVINLTMFLHFLDLDDQREACRRLLRLLKPGPDNWIIGIQTGCLNAGRRHLPGSLTIYRHSLETFRHMWEDVGTQENIQLDFQGEYGKELGLGGYDNFADDENRRLHFLVKTI